MFSRAQDDYLNNISTTNNNNNNNNKELSRSTSHP